MRSHVSLVRIFLIFVVCFSVLFSSGEKKSDLKLWADEGSRFGFEKVKAGPFDQLKTPVGIWRSETGRVLIDDKHAKTGKQCLQLSGGKESTVTLDMAETVKRASELTFWAERWTSRSPFSFRIAIDRGKGLQDIYDGSRTIRVGRAFLNHVKVELPVGVKRLQFSCSSPPNTGILIDELQVAPKQPQEIISVEILPLTIPTLIGKEASALLKLKIETRGQLNPISVTELQAMPAGDAKQSEILSFQLRHGAGQDRFLSSKTVASLDAGQIESKPLIFSCHPDACPLVEGVNFLWISCRLNKKADIDHRVGVSCQKVSFSDGKTIKLNQAPSIQRMGVALRNGGDDGVHTYRIPGLATTNKGTLIGVYDVRRRSGGDLPGDIDVGMSRSTDGGRTWEPMKVIMDMGNDPRWKYDGIGDPSILVDRTTGSIWVAATWSHGNRSWRGSGPGLKPEETGQLMLSRSDDDGVTWSEPINITEQVKKPEWCFILQGPGKGITMRDGTIVFAAQYQDTPERKRLPRSTILYSRDHGMTWDVGTGAFDDTTEAQVVEIEPGTLMLNCRYNRKAVRVVMTTDDMGKTWRKHATSERSLIEPRACMASLIDPGMETGSDLGEWLLFSNPDSVRGRHRITIKASPDRGQTWPKEHRLLLDEETSAGYSCMSMIDERTVGILYEGSQAHMTFQRIPLKDLIDKKLAHKEIPLEADQAMLRLPRVFGDHMVLQADSPIPVWGDSRAGASVMVLLGDEKKKVRADEGGKWSVRMDSRPASRKPIEMTISSGSERIVLKDVLIGEVWLCAGQSNMEWSLAQSAGVPEGLVSAVNPHLRLLNLAGGARGSSGSYAPEHLLRLTPETFCEGVWKVSCPDTARSFSAVGWFFGRRLQKELDVPVGLICPAVGGTPTEAWVPSEALKSNPGLKGLVAGNWLDNERLGQFCRMRGQQNLLAAIQSGLTIPGDQFGPNHSFKPGFMWKAGIEPLAPYAIRGVIWYQGESNAETKTRALEHRELFPLLVKEWRKEWGQGNFPFLLVQLPALNRPVWPLFREGQRRVLDQLENIGMAVTIDTGHPTDVHPKEKKPVGERLAKWALGTTYALKKHTTYSGPLLDVVEREGDSLVVSFNQVGEGLKTSDKKAPLHFEVCGEDGVFHPADAKIIGENTLSVASPKVAAPRHARYAWSPYPDPPVNLINSEDLPASPFSSESEDAVFALRDEQPIEKINKDTRPNILLIVGEDHGCELSCYGDPIINTPNIDALAADGVLFENGYVTQSVCSPSRSTIFTGLYPHQNGQLGLATHKYAWFEKWPTTYSLLKNQGYRTGLIGKTHVVPEAAVEDFVDFRFQKSSNFAKRKVADYASKAGEFFADGDEPFFMTVNYPDAHWPLQGKVDGLPGTQVDPGRVKVMPYVGGSNPRLREIARNYYDSMLRLDACVGQLLNQLENSGKAGNTLVVFIGDHGAQMARGKVTVYEGGLRVPYIVRWPGTTKPNHRSRALVSTIDLLPTLMDAAGVPVPKGLPGKSLRSVLKGDEGTGESFRKYLACERNCDAAQHAFPQRTIRDARYKLIHSPIRDREDPAARYYRNHGASHWAGCLTDKELTGASQQTKLGYARWLKPPEFQLYDLKADPHEWTDLSNDTKHAETKRRLQTALKEWQADTRDPVSDRVKLSMLMKENDAVFKAGRRWPREGWQYLKYLAPSAPTSLPIFRADSDKLGSHKYENYREPVVVRAKSGRLILGVQAGNRLSWPERSGQDLVIRTSDDNGKTWSPMIVAAEHGDYSCQCHGLVYDEQINRVLFLYTVYNWDYKAIGKGRGGKYTHAVYEKLAATGKPFVTSYLVHSDDEGRTWSKPLDITKQVGKQAHFGASEGRQLTLGKHQGRLIIAGSRMDLDGKGRITAKHPGVWKSDDHGKTWTLSMIPLDPAVATPRNASSEARITELHDGRLLYNERTRNTGRHLAWSKDGGETWTKTRQSVDLKVTQCNGSMVTLLDADGQLTRTVLFSIPSPGGRSEGLVCVSHDGGKTWPQSKQVTQGFFAYSALIQLDSETIGLFYESNRYKDIRFVALPLENILN